MGNGAAEVGFVDAKRPPLQKHNGCNKHDLHTRRSAGFAGCLDWPWVPAPAFSDSFIGVVLADSDCTNRCLGMDPDMASRHADNSSERCWDFGSKRPWRLHLGAKEASPLSWGVPPASLPAEGALEGKQRITTADPTPATKVLWMVTSHHPVASPRPTATAFANSQHFQLLVIRDLLRWCGDGMNRSTQVAPVDIWAQSFACHRAIGQTLDGWAALSWYGPLPSEPLVHRGWRHA